MDRHGVINRNNDIIYSDRTHQEENMFLVVSDYIDIVKALLKVSKDHDIKDVIINNLLNQKTRYNGEFLKAWTFRDIIEGRFQIDEIVNITRENDEHTISNKSYDFFVGTIKQLLELGYNDGSKALRDYIENLARSR